jgi:hypothetical protein
VQILLPDAFPDVPVLELSERCGGQTTTGKCFPLPAPASSSHQAATKRTIMKVLATSLRLSASLFLVSQVACDVLQLTEENFDSMTQGKTVFLKVSCIRILQRLKFCFFPSASNSSLYLSHRTGKT